MWLTTEIKYLESSQVFSIISLVAEFMIDCNVVSDKCPHIFV